jgi:hypothetical protein
VRRHEHRPAPSSQAADQPSHLLDALRIEAVGRFVEDEQLGVAQQRGSDPEPLLHAERVAAIPVLGPAGQAHQLQQVGDESGVLASRDGQHFEVPAAADRRVERRRFDERTDGAQERGRAIDGPAEHGACARRGPDEAEQHGHGRGLAGAVGTDEARHHAPRQFEAEAIHHCAVAVPLRQIGD